MGKKKGRPKKEIARTFGYRLRLSMGELYALEYIQEISGKSKAQIIRDGIRDQYNKATEAAKIGSNFEIQTKSSDLLDIQKIGGLYGEKWNSC